VISCPPGILFSSYDNAPNLISFVFGDLFQGYAILAQKDGNYKSYREFIEEGLTPNEALIAAAKQLKGKTFTYPSETAISPFIELVLQKGQLTSSDFKPLVLEDALTINAMRKKDADFQVGGVPSRLVLQSEGFKPIISSIDIVQTAKPSADSKELASILQNGWATTKEFYTNNFETILRLASVNYRIMDFINTHENEALDIHMKYLTQVTGEDFNKNNGRVIYSDLDPFFTFEKQYDWFYNDSSLLFYSYVNGSILNSFKKNGIFKGIAPNVENVIYADDVYKKLFELKMSCDALFTKIESNPTFKNDGLLLEAKKQYSIYNFLDAEKIAKKIVSAK
jgi:hypothetical protein